MPRAARTNHERVKSRAAGVCKRARIMRFSRRFKIRREQYKIPLFGAIISKLRKRRGFINTLRRLFAVKFIKQRVFAKEKAHI